MSYPAPSDPFADCKVPRDHVEVYSCLMASDEDAGRAAMGRTMSALLADVSPMYARDVAK